MSEQPSSAFANHGLHIHRNRHSLFDVASGTIELYLSVNQGNGGIVIGQMR